MDAAARSRLLRWLFLLSPCGSLVSFALGLWFLEATTTGKALSTFLANASGGSLPIDALVFPNLTLVALGWLLLTLGCSAGTCLHALRRQGKARRTLAIYMVLATPVLAAAHLTVSAGIVGAGCAVVMGQH